MKAESYQYTSYITQVNAGNLGISQEIQPICRVDPSTIVLEGGKHTLNYYIYNYLGLQMA